MRTPKNLIGAESGNRMSMATASPGGGRREPPSAPTSILTRPAHTFGVVKFSVSFSRPTKAAENVPQSETRCR